jgi:hypothetical protein
LNDEVAANTLKLKITFSRISDALMAIYKLVWDDFVLGS